MNMWVIVHPQYMQQRLLFPTICEENLLGDPKQRNITGPIKRNGIIHIHDKERLTAGFFC